jgi:23S rRNA pseudouridine2605 synthase
MFDSINHSVVKLRRVRIGHIADTGLAFGGYRELTQAEVKRFFQSPPPKASQKPKRVTARPRASRANARPKQA